MITVTEKDIGKTVVYTPPHTSQHSLGGFKSADAYVSEEGVIVGFNAAYVFVRYGDDPASKATHPQNLHWKNPC